MQNTELSFAANQADFYQFLTECKEVNSHSRTNYISWLKFLSKRYRIDGTLTDDYIDWLINEEQTQQKERAIYNNKRDLTNFRSALRKFKTFLDSDFLKLQNQTILSEIKKVDNDPGILQTEKEAIIASRVGQGVFRRKLIEYWQGCSVNGPLNTDLLVASHIKPWHLSNNRERLDLYNGLLLVPNMDKLFDRGYISFLDSGKIRISKLLEDFDCRVLGIYNTLRLLHIEEHHKSYLAYHRAHCLMM